ncbi:uncharacterized protein ATC70_011744 [Mucor velutinosus]|uniref:Uncharacterized protein n=1 Tax=Mucor velutinosus TaxID=708070 RepID=A0AAN7DFY6_9FUNG|nr:hypothetical protein ATC70_011744 [Mucor velutinosus]
MIRKVSATSILLACALMTAQAQDPMAVPTTNMASIFQNMVNYFNEHPFTDSAGRPSQAFQSMLRQMQSTEAANANPATDSAANVALPVAPPTVADIGLPAVAAPMANNVNAAIKSAPADIPIALAAGVPASVAAAAAIPANQKPAQPVVPATPAPPMQPLAAPATQENAVVVSAEPAPNAAEQPAVAPATPQGPSAVAEPVVSTNPVASNVAVAEPIVPVTTVTPSQTSAVPPVVVPTTSASLSGSVTTGTSMMTRTNAMSTASLSVTRSLTSSASASRSASPTMTIPPISASNSLQQGHHVLLSMTLGLVAVIVTMISSY